MHPLSDIAKKPCPAGDSLNPGRCHAMQFAWAFSDCFRLCGIPALFRGTSERLPAPRCPCFIDQRGNASRMHRAVFSAKVASGFHPAQKRQLRILCHAVLFSPARAHATGVYADLISRCRRVVGNAIACTCTHSKILWGLMGAIQFLRLNAV